MLLPGGVGGEVVTWWVAAGWMVLLECRREGSGGYAVSDAQIHPP